MQSLKFKMKVERRDLGVAGKEKGGRLGRLESLESLELLLTLPKFPTLPTLPTLPNPAPFPSFPL